MGAARVGQEIQEEQQDVSSEEARRAMEEWGREEAGFPFANNLQNTPALLHLQGRTTGESETGVPRAPQRNRRTTRPATPKNIVCCLVFPGDSLRPGI